jgi:hypothetical protein
MPFRLERHRPDRFEARRQSDHNWLEDSADFASRCVGEELAVSTCVGVLGAHPREKKGAVQVPELGLEIRGVAGPADQDAARFSRSVRSGSDV